MSGNQKYRVIPRQVELKPIPSMERIPLTKYEKKGVEGIPGCAIFGPPFVICLCTVAWSAHALGSLERALWAGVLAAMGYVVIVALLHFLIVAVKSDHRSRLKAQNEIEGVERANERALSDAENEASRLTLSMMTTYESSAVVAAELPKCLSRAADLLQDANQEFRENAFGPFWDKVESAARQLAAFNDKLSGVSKDADRYYRGLQGTTHTFPAFHTNPSNVPDPIPVLNELRRVVRKGQTNIDFARIWESRQTREVLIAGFRALGEAINNVGTTVENAMYGLEQSLSSDVARLVQEEIKTRDSLDTRMMEQNRMLDNIQHHRRPGVLDTPSKY